MPGRISYVEAYRRFVEVFGIPGNAENPQEVITDDIRAVPMTLPGTTDPQYAPVIATFYTDDSIVQRISIGPSAGWVEAGLVAGFAAPGSRFFLSPVFA